jgi:hypothetical protein
MPQCIPDGLDSTIPIPVPTLLIETVAAYEETGKAIRNMESMKTDSK